MTRIGLIFAAKCVNRTDNLTQCCAARRCIKGIMFREFRIESMQRSYILACAKVIFAPQVIFWLCQSYISAFSRS